MLRKLLPTLECKGEMSRQQKKDEQFPLLLFLVGGDDEGLSRSNKRFFRGRLEHITSGATAVITEWPNHINSCWVTGLICTVTLFLAAIFLMASTMSLQEHHRMPRCVQDLPNNGHRTIHLVHNSHKWSQNQLKTIEDIIQSFPNYTISLTIIKDPYMIFPKVETTSHDSDDKLLGQILSGNYNTTKELRPLTGNYTTTTTTVKNAITNKKPGHSERTIEEMAQRHHMLVFTYKNYNDIFESTPLFLNWPMLNDLTKVFATRVLQLWQFGGLSFDLSLSSHQATRNLTKLYRQVHRKIKRNGVMLASLIREGKKRFEDLATEEISVDKFGLHMEAKIPCHAFFGKVLMKMKHVGPKVYPKSVLRGPMSTFCRANVIKRRFCDGIME